jgi:hypothetical protein
MPSAKFEYASAKIKIVRISAIEVRGMTEAGRFQTDERDDRERDAVHQLERAGPTDGHRVHQQPGIEGEDEAEEEDERLGEHVQAADDFVEGRALAHADDVEHRQAADYDQHDDEVGPGMHCRAEDRNQLTEIVDAAPGEEHDVDREVE